MKIQVSLSSTFKTNVFQMFTDMSDTDKEWFRLGLPTGIRDWLTGDFNGKVRIKTKKLLESYSAVSEADIKKVMKKGDIESLLKSFWLIRKCHGPIKVKTLYRVTAFSEPISTRTIQLTREGQQKALTSWSTHKDVHVVNRKGSDNDYKLTYSNPAPKHILMNTSILHHLCEIVLRDIAFFGLDRTSKFKPNFRGRSAGYGYWQTLLSECKRFRAEEEYLIFLDDGESITCGVEKYKQADAN